MGRRAEKRRVRQRAMDERRERSCIGKKWNWHGSEIAVREIEHMSIFIHVNQ
jgi:hypothetical protein